MMFYKQMFLNVSTFLKRTLRMRKALIINILFMPYVQGSYQRLTLHFAFSQVNHVSNPIANESPKVCPLNK